MITRIKAAFIVGYADGDHRILPDAELVHENDTVLFVGRDYSGPVDREVDAGLSIVSPGFIDLNALADIDHAIFDSWHGPATRLGLVRSEAHLQSSSPVFTPEELCFRREFALTQLALNGITTLMPIAAESYLDWCEDYEDLAHLATAVEDIGLRAYLGPSYRTHVPYTDGQRVLLHEDEQRGLDGLAEAIRFARDHEGRADGRIRTALLPARIETQTEKTLWLTRQTADELGIPVRLHAAQGLSEVETMIERTGMRPLPYLHSIGFLAEQTFIPHAWTVPGHRHMPDAYGDGDDLALLAESGTTVVFCPIPSAHYGSVLEDYDAYRARGIRVVMGTDSAPPNMIRGLDLAMAMQKSATGDRAAAQAGDLFRSATLDPAEALGRDDLGRLEPGCQADYFVLDLTGRHIGPYADPIRTLVLNADGRDISRVVVAGRTVVEDHEVVTVDTSDHRRRAQDFLNRYMASLTDSDHARRPLEELLPPSFPLA
ncbi:chlorohydrolase family protein [Arthrobacter woluwensis]|uniref:chlorohydrolase family protein n=1 Tax=Arthrobacter woluwensis TaxID=156980 RepID=UPI001AAFC467|nr:chlorohydrolase family protein [Arthrobacter woluwensis]QTF72278.1 amidohydrolase family protein [Arthrobacter woluwensis]